MKFFLINSNNFDSSGSFVAAYVDGSIYAKYSSDYFNQNENSAFLKSPDKLVYCLKYINDKISEESIGSSSFDAISVIIGPASFTGIRVGIALAKGLADSLCKKIIPIDNFELVSMQAQNLIHSKNYCVLIPAKLPEFYYMVFNNNVKVDSGCVLINEMKSKFNKNIILVGNFSDDYEKKLGYFDVINVKDLKSELDSMIALTIQNYNNDELFESNQIEPLYLKDFTFKKVYK